MDLSEWQTCAEMLKALFSIPVPDDGGAGEHASRLPDSSIPEVLETRQDRRGDVELIGWQLSTLLGDSQWFLIDTSQLVERLSPHVSQEQASTLYALIYSHDRNDLEQIVGLFLDWVAGWLEPKQPAAAPGNGS